jgi:hypothetical protein
MKPVHNKGLARFHEVACVELEMATGPAPVCQQKTMLHPKHPWNDLIFFVLSFVFPLLSNVLAILFNQTQLRDFINILFNFQLFVIKKLVCDKDVEVEGVFLTLAITSAK